VGPSTPTEATTFAAEPYGDGDTGRRGRPRSKERERQILAAALHPLVTEGFDAMTIEGVAAAAGAGKATVYRRWRNKVDLVIDAIREQVSVRAEIVDTGDIGADMRSFLTLLQCDLLGPNGALLAAFMAERLRHPILAEAFEAQYKSQKRAELRRLSSGRSPGAPCRPRPTSNCWPTWARRSWCTSSCSVVAVSHVSCPTGSCANSSSDTALRITAPRIPRCLEH